MPVSVAARIFSRSCIVSFAIASRLPDSTVLNGSTFVELRLRLDHRRHPLQAVHHLRVHRMLDPQRAVLVEGGDARLRRHELRARLVGGRLHELDDRLLRGAVVPRGQRIGLGVRLRAHASRQQERKQASVCVAWMRFIGVIHPCRSLLCERGRPTLGPPRRDITLASGG